MSLLMLAGLPLLQLVPTASASTNDYLTMSVNPAGSGSASPASGYHPAYSRVEISAQSIGGYSFVSWSGSGQGSYSGTNERATVTMYGAITEVANFAYSQQSTQFPVLSPHPPHDAYSVSTVWGDAEGDLSSSNYSPPVQVPLSMPITVSLNGVSGESGHIAYGSFNILQYRSAYPGYPYSNFEFALRIDNAQVSTDNSLIRIAIATAWVDPNGKTYYLEFDLWDSANTIAGMQNPSYVFSQPNGAPPTVEVKSAQLPVGAYANYEIPMHSYFQRVYGINNVTLNHIYLVVEKTSPNSVVNIQAQFQLLELW